jgi:hypothetical protein
VTNDSNPKFELRRSDLHYRCPANTFIPPGDWVAAPVPGLGRLPVTPISVLSHFTGFREPVASSVEPDLHLLVVDPARKLALLQKSSVNPRPELQRMGYKWWTQTSQCSQHTQPGVTTVPNQPVGDSQPLKGTVQYRH